MVFSGVDIFFFPITELASLEVYPEFFFNSDFRSVTSLVQSFLLDSFL